MAKQRYKKEVYARKKEKVSSILVTMAVIVVAFAAIVTLNTFIPFSDSLPTWKNIRQEFFSYFESTKAPQSILPTDGELTVHFIDVGQGNSTLILSDQGNVLIDAGEVDQGATVVNYLKKHQVTELAYAVASHPHSDHIGGMDDVLRSVKVNHLIMPEIKDEIIPTTRVYEDLLNAIEEKEVDVLAAKLGDIYELGAEKITILGPSGDFDDLNECSVAVKVSYGSRSFLTTGDMGKKAETALLESGQDVSADVFLMSHHGSKKSNTAKFLDAIKPTYAIAQMGYGNEYGHPHNEAVKRVLDCDAIFLRSDVSGNIVFKTDGTTLEVVKEKTNS